MSISITIDNLDDAVVERLEAEARRRGMNIESAVKELLHEALERTGNHEAASVQHDLDTLAGTWSEEEANEFLEVVKDFGHVDKDLWR
jgi:hypothetical protein